MKQKSNVAVYKMDGKVDLLSIEFPVIGTSVTMTEVCVANHVAVQTAVDDWEEDYVEEAIYNKSEVAAIFTEDQQWINPDVNYLLNKQ